MVLRLLPHVPGWAYKLWTWAGNDKHSLDEKYALLQMITRNACRAGRVLFIQDGQVYHQIYRGTMNDDQLYQAVSATLTQLATSHERSVAVHG